MHIRPEGGIELQFTFLPFSFIRLQFGNIIQSCNFDPGLPLLKLITIHCDAGIACCRHVITPFSFIAVFPLLVSTDLPQGSGWRAGGGQWADVSR